tara:strand:- start:231 stop:806 length:576 start_codon:yes stop_codon:yes gene_type:complete
MTIYGYFRCSTNLQDEERQIRALKDAKVDFINGDKITGTSNFNSRPELSKLLKKMDSGSVLVISELSRLSRSFLGMVNEISVLLERGIQIRTLDGRLDTTAMPKEITMLIVSILGYAASQELQQIKSRTAEGRSVALSRGVKFGAKRKYTKEQALLVCEMRSQGKGWGTIAKSMNFTVAKCRRIVDLEVAL